MKRIALLILVLALLLPSAALAEGVFLHQAAMPGTYDATVIPGEFYPVARLRASFANELLAHTPAEPVFVTFPAPAGAQVARFGYRSLLYLDNVNEIQYSYDMDDYPTTLQEFVNNADSPDYVVMQPADGMAAFIDPEYNSAYGLIKTSVISEDATLRVYVHLDGMSYSDPIEEKIPAITEAILNEMERLRQNMTYERVSPFWNVDTFSGVKFVDTFDLKTLYSVTIPTLPTKDGSAAPFWLTEVNDTIMKGLYITGEAKYDSFQYAEIEAGVSIYPYAQDNLQAGKEGTEWVTMDNGVQWAVYLSSLDPQSQRYFQWFASRLIEDHQDYAGKAQYLTIHVSSTNGYDLSRTGILELLNAFEAGFSITDLDSDPYPLDGATVAEAAPAEEPAVEETVVEDIVAEEPAVAEAASSLADVDGDALFESAFVPADVDLAAVPGQVESVAWVCPNCGQENEGNFCTNCGAIRPEEEPEAEATWFCPNCGQENEGNFCTNCGTPRPEDKTWFCPNCGRENDGNFCADCGTPKP